MDFLETVSGDYIGLRSNADSCWDGQTKYGEKCPGKVTTLIHFRIIGDVFTTLLVMGWRHSGGRRHGH